MTDEIPGLVEATNSMDALSAAFEAHINHLQTESDSLQAALVGLNNV